MNALFAEKIKREGIVDTEQYRYVYQVGFDGAEIRRIKLDKLGTTAALEEWELVRKYN